MLHCERGTSVFFPPIDKVVQVYSCRIVEFFSCSRVNNKKLQKSICCKDDCVGPPIKKLESVCIATDSLTTPTTILYSSESDETNKENMYRGMGGDDTMINWEPPLASKGAKLTKRGKQTDHEIQDTKKKYRRRKRSSRTSKGIQSSENTPNYSTFVNTKQVAFDKKSLISIFRKKKKTDKNQQCQCPLEADTNTLRDPNKKHKNDKTNIKFEVKPNNDHKNHINVDKYMFKNVLVEKKCYEGICSKESKKKAKDFVCTCLHKKEPGVICSDDTCGMMDLSSFSKFKDKAWYLCHKSLQKLGVSRINDTNKICDDGICKEAFTRENPNISCICKEKIKQCSDETCVPKAARLKKPTCCNKSTPPCRWMFKLFRSRRNANLKRRNVVVRNEMEQTGDPIFEMKVNEMGMCILNSSEIKDKVKTLGEIKKRECICPSHAALKQKILERKVCVTGPCQIAVKNKMTDFSCKCLKNKILTCTDTTCNKVVTFSDNKKARIRRDGTRDDSVDKCVTNTGTNKLYDKPLFEVKLDNDKMCIINSNEIQQNIHRWKLCRSDMNKEKLKDKTTCILCKCCTGMESGECTEQRRRDASDTKRYCICGNKHTKMIRNGFDTASIKVIKSKISVFCNRMCSKSENLIKGTKKNKLRSRKTLLGTKSENVHKRDGLKIHINKNGKRRHFVLSNTAPNIKNNDQEIKSTTIKKDPKRIPYSSLFPESRKPVKNITAGDSEKSKDVKPTRINKKESKNENEKSKAAKPTRINKKESKNEKKTQKPHPVKISSPKVSKKPLDTKTPAECVCQHICACDKEMKKIRLKAKRDMKLNKHKVSSKKKLESKKQKKKKQKSKIEDLKYATETKQKRKELLKEKKQLLKEEAKRQKIQKKEDREVIKLLESEEGASKSNCFVEIIASIASFGFAVVKVVLFAFFKTIFTPVKTYRYVRQRCEDPTGTWLKIKKEMRRGWKMRKLKVCKCFRNSDKANIIADAFRESAIYNTFVDKGKTKKEQAAFELEVKTRKKRVRKRQEAALYGCRHVLLTTLRKTPCLWVYHICPNYYPQCLSLISAFKQFGNIFLFTLAFACWTPCIVLCEVTRALFCCLLCTG